jgi:predicted metal-dependent hydrolase
MSLNTVRVFAITKLPWIKKQQHKLREQERETPGEYINRESHYFWGKRYLLKVVEADQPASVELIHSRMILRVRPGASTAKRQVILDEWHREQLRNAVPPVIKKMGAAHGGQGPAVLCPTNEDEMGELQPPRGCHPIEYGSRKKAEGMPRIYCCA